MSESQKILKLSVIKTNKTALFSLLKLVIFNCGFSNKSELQFYGAETYGQQEMQ